MVDTLGLVSGGIWQALYSASWGMRHREIDRSEPADLHPWVNRVQMRMGAPRVELEGAWLRSDLTCRSQFPGGNETGRGWMKKIEDQPSSTGVTRVW